MCVCTIFVRLDTVLLPHNRCLHIRASPYCICFATCSLLDELLEYEEELQRGCFSEEVLAASKKICLEEGGRALNFLSLVVLPLLDTNKDDVVDRTELLGLQVWVIA